MEKNKKMGLALVLVACLTVACSEKKDAAYWEHAPVVAEKVGDLIALDPALLKDTIVFPLSFFAEAIEIVKLDDRDEALVYPTPVMLSENFILAQSGKPNTRSFEEWQASIPMPCKLFDKKGNYIADIGAIGQGPGEYQTIYSMQIDEKGERIYLLPWQSDQILTYDLKGNFLEPIRLPYRANKGVFKVEGDRVTVAVLPFPQIPLVGWTQTLAGEVIHEIPAGHLAMEFDFSNEIMSAENTGAMDLSFWYWPARVDTLYHINTANGSLTPQFTARFKEDRLEPHSYVEWPDYFVGNTSTIVTVTDGNGQRQEGQKPTYYIVDKKTLRGAFYRVENDYLGGEDMDWPMGLFNKGYYARNMDPGNLEEWIEKLLKSEALPAPMREKLTDIQKTIGPDDNNYVVYAKMKQR